MRQTSFPPFRPDKCPCGLPWDMCPWSELVVATAREPDGGGFGGTKCLIRCGSPPSKFRCPRCGAVSYNPNDIRERYCGRCHAFVDDLCEAGARASVVDRQSLMTRIAAAQP
jgi:hypothetical protein